MDGLIIKGKWIDSIFNFEKSIEIRGVPTNKTGQQIALIKSKSSMIYGTTIIYECIQFLDADMFDNMRNLHQYEFSFEKLKKDFGYKKVFGWVFYNIEKFLIPIPYKHPQGAVIWVKDVL